jgi:5-methylcytosine-specific restriction enzyme A
VTWSTEPDRYRGVSRAQADRIRARDGHTCQKCGAFGHEVDHIGNVKGGGCDDDANLQVLCATCHMTKTQAEATAARARRQAEARLPVEDHPGLIQRQP